MIAFPVAETEKTPQGRGALRPSPRNETIGPYRPRLRASHYLRPISTRKCAPPTPVAIPACSLTRLPGFPSGSPRPLAGRPATADAPCRFCTARALSPDTLPRNPGKGSVYLASRLYAVWKWTVNGWELTTEGGILKSHRAWKVKNFVKGLEFFQLVAAVAEGEDLHLVDWNNVKIDVWTHSVRGLTENFVLAAKINQLNLESLLSKKKANVHE